MDNTQLTERQQALLRDLSSWATLQNVFTTLENEEEVEWLMKAEKAGQNRIRVLTRLYSRLNVVRKERELRDLSDGKLPFGG